MKEIMNKHGRIVLPAFVAGILAFSLGSASALDMGDEAKLKELENALKSPASPAPIKKPRTRAIVFDNDAGATAAPATATAAVSETKPARIGDCAALPADVKTTPVDFAIQFKSGSADLAPASEETLRQIAKILALSPDRCILVEGHTDAVGNFEKNMALSKDRSSSVVKFIVEKAGMDASRLVPIGKGQTEPVKNTDPRDSKNRRVVFKVVG
jgi:outer membrane protein OmpA-like peptidoglycan-associated protein